MSSTVLIIGAGMAGVTAARRLREAGLHPVLFDKGRRPGGRMATRSIGKARFDQGAQHFSVRSEEFAGDLEDLAPGVVKEWFRSGSVTRPERGTESRHAGSNGMRSIVEALADDIEIHSSVTITHLSVGQHGVEVFAGPLSVGQGASVIVTPPLPQTLKLLTSSNIDLPIELEAELQAIEYEACIAVMAELDAPSQLDNGHASLHEGPVAWIGDNHHKGISRVPAITIHSTPGYAAENLEADPGSWASQLSDAASRHLRGRIIEATPHRWRFSRPKTALDTGAAPIGEASKVVLAGEVFHGARVEGAFHSGREAARIVLESLSNS